MYQPKKHIRRRASRGITLAVSQYIRENYTVIYKSDQDIAFLFRRPKIGISVSYFQPKYETEELIQEVVDVLCKANRNYHILLFGEFNCKIDMSDEQRENLFVFLQDTSLTC